MLSIIRDCNIFGNENVTNKFCKYWSKKKKLHRRAWCIIDCAHKLYRLVMDDTDKIDTIKYRFFPSNITCIDTYQYDNHTHFK